MSEIRTNKIAALGADIQFWTGTPTEKLRMDAVGNLCFGASGAAGAHIPPHDGYAPMYSARAWGRIVTDPVTGEINQSLSKTNNIDMNTANTKWYSAASLIVVFTTPLATANYVVVGNCNKNSAAPLLVARANSAVLQSTTTGFGLSVYNALGTSNSGFNTETVYPELIEFVVFE